MVISRASRDMHNAESRTLRIYTAGGNAVVMYVRRAHVCRRCRKAAGNVVSARLCITDEGTHKRGLPWKCPLRMPFNGMSYSDDEWSDGRRPSDPSPSSPTPNSHGRPLWSFPFVESVNSSVNPVTGEDNTALAELSPLSSNRHRLIIWGSFHPGNHGEVVQTFLPPGWATASGRRQSSFNIDSNTAESVVLGSLPATLSVIPYQFHVQLAFVRARASNRCKPRADPFPSEENSLRRSPPSTNSKLNEVQLLPR